MTRILLILVWVGSWGSSLLAQHAPARHSPLRPTPTLRWKYGWRDGLMANTIGSARSGDSLPALSMEVASGYSPADLSFAYGYSRITNGGDGSDQTIAIMIPFATSTNHLQADLDHFSSYYMLPSTTLKFYTPNGTNTPYKDTSQWYSEATLDVEWAHAMAPAASIALIIAPDDYSLSTNSLFDCATGTNVGQAGAGVVSMSWANPEDQYSTQDWSGIFTNPYVSYVAASGDNGTRNGSMGVEWPAAHSNVISVGGTSLIYDSERQLVVSETAWRKSGGGISSYEAMPDYQRAYLSAEQTNIFNQAQGFRCVPDVSYDGDPYTGLSVWITDPKSKKGGWVTMGGTSASTPQVAALIARRRSLGRNEQAPANPYFYGTNSALLLWDIVWGYNGYQAGDGYDLVSGLGAPIADAFVSISPTNSLLRPQGISFSKITNKCVYGGPSISLQATADSGLPVIFSSSDSTIFTVTPDGTLTPVNAGIASVIVQQPGDGAAWTAAEPVTNSLMVAKAPQSLEKFSPIAVKLYRSGSFIVTPPAASSRLPVILKVTSGHARVATNNGTNSILLSGLGKVVLSASQPGYDPTTPRSRTNYFAAKPVSISFSVK